MSLRTKPSLFAPYATKLTIWPIGRRNYETLEENYWDVSDSWGRLKVGCYNYPLSR